VNNLPPGLDRESALRRDAQNPLAERSGLFALPEGIVYLDGNSLGALPRAVPARVQEVVTEQWGRGLISSWNTADWINLAGHVGTRIAPLVGADAADLHLGESTSVGLFKTMVAACRLRPERRVMVVERSTFPTDGYVAAGVADLLGLQLRWCDADDLDAALDEDVALLSLTHVDFRTGAMFDLDKVTASAHAVGALVLWDLCHSVGAVPVDLTGADADFAVGCTYKYLNGGPGSPAFSYAAPRHQPSLQQPIPGWMGHAEPFAMDLGYRPADGMSRMASGTPPILALAALDAALDAFDGVDLRVLREVSLSLTGYFLQLVDARLGSRLEVVTPRDPDRRGSQVSLRHLDAYGIVQALVARGVIGDFRTPDLARFGFAPLYVAHADVYDAVQQLVEVLDEQEYARPEYAAKKAVT
jgi:kynureninase